MTLNERMNLSSKWKQIFKECMDNWKNDNDCTFIFKKFNQNLVFLFSQLNGVLCETAHVPSHQHIKTLILPHCILFFTVHSGLG